MNVPDVIILLLCGWSAINSIFIGLYLYLNKRVKKNEANKILGTIFFLVSFKIAYPVLFGPEFKPGLFHHWYYQWIVVCYMLIGSLFYIYTKSLLQNIFYFKKVHFFVLVPVISVLFIPSEFKGYYLRFIVIQSWVIVFLLLSGIEIVKSRFINKNQQKKYLHLWLSSLLLGILTIWTTVLIEYFIELVAFFSFIILVMIYVLIEKKSIIHSDYASTKNSKLKIEKNEEEDIVSRLNEKMEKEKLYLNNELSLPLLADKIEVPLYLLSKVLNEGLKKNFSEYVNNYRINEAKKKLLDKKFAHLNIAAIAYDCGFNSLSTFNTFFKKLTNTTPSRYKKSKLELNYHNN